MNDRERIEAMVESGRITREQADQLIAVLDETDNAEHEVDALQEGQPQETPNASFGNTVRAAILPVAGGGQEQSQYARSTHDQLDADLKWLEVDTFAGNLEIRVVNGLTAPEVVDGHITTTSNGARVTQWENDDAGGSRSFLDKVVDGFRSADMEVRIPSGWGIHFDVKAGNIDVAGAVASVKGHLRAGDLTVKDTARADVKVTAGEAEIGLRAASGQHRVSVSVGQADIRILPGSNLDVSANVKFGDISARSLTKDERGIGARATGHVGNGASGSGGHLDVAVVTGDVKIREADHG